MVKSKAKAKSEELNAIELLEADHREVAELFDEFEGADPSELEAITEQICQKLTVHAQIEEEILYPAAKGALEEDDADLVNEAQVEHASAKDLIAQIENMTNADELYKATVKVLSEYIKHHVEEEEEELFPLLEKTELDLDDMGAQLASRKLELLAELSADSENDDSASDTDDDDEDEGDDDDDEEEDEAVDTKADAKDKSKGARKRA